MALRIAFTLENRLADIHRIRDINGTRSSRCAPPLSHGEAGCPVTISQRAAHAVGAAPDIEGPTRLLNQAKMSQQTTVIL
jgi:hypothetical protein